MGWFRLPGLPKNRPVSLPRIYLKNIMVFGSTPNRHGAEVWRSYGLSERKSAVSWQAQCGAGSGKPCNTTGFSGTARPTERFVARVDGGAVSPVPTRLRPVPAGRSDPFESLVYSEPMSRPGCLPSGGRNDCSPPATPQERLPRAGYVRHRQRSQSHIRDGCPA